MRALLWTMLARLKGFLHPAALDAEFDDELLAHLAMAEEDGMRRGLTREEARRAARAALGGVTQLREAGRATRGLPWLDGLGLDVRLGLRMLRRSWGLTMAGGLAMTVVILVAAVLFTFLDELMGRTAPPLDEGDRVVAIQTWDAAAHRRRDTSRRDLARWREILTSVEDLGGFQTVERTLAIDGRPAGWERFAEISASGFRLARVQPLMGRWLADADERENAPPVVVIGHDVWRARFASDPSVVGRTVRIGDTIHTVVGVMPERFAFPLNHRLWIPLKPHPSGSLRHAPQGVVFARLAPGVTLEGAQAELATAGLLRPAPPQDTREQWRPRVVPYTFAFTDDVERGELAWRQRELLFLVTLLLVPPCANIAILVYARTVTRQEEFAARYALGASRGRIVVQLFVEVLVLAAAAAGVALALARPVLAQVGAIFSRHPELGGALPFWADFAFTARTGLFVAGLAILAALIAGLAPALRATGRVMREGLRAMGGRGSVPLGATWTALIVAQVGLAVAALPSAAELAWGHLRPAVLGPGFAAGDFLTARLAPDLEQSSAGDADRASFAARLRALRADVVRQVEAEPAVSAVTLSASLPGVEPYAFFEIDEGATGARRVTRYPFRANLVDAAFLDVFDVSLLAGRTFDAGDFGAARTAIVGRTFVQQVLGEGNALGRRVRLGPAPGAEAGPWYEIVGVVEDVPANTSQGRLYLPAAAGMSTQTGEMYLTVHAGRATGTLTRRMQEIAAGLDPVLRMDNVRPLDDVYREAQTIGILTASALAVTTLSVLLLSAAGLYALSAYTVTRRRREIGIRTALGAPSSRLLAGVFARALGQIAAGAFVGVTAALVLHRGLNLEMAGGWHIPGVLPATVIFMLAIGLMAVAGPARRALRVNPTEALREGA